MHHDFATYFDVTHQTLRVWTVPFLGIFFAFVTASIAFPFPFMKSMLRYYERPDALIKWTPLGRKCTFLARKIFFSLFAMAAAYSAIDYYHQLERQQIEAVQTLKWGNYSVVSGYITNMKIDHERYQTFESFDINGRHFAFSDADINVGLHYVTVNDKSLRNGMYVKVIYVNRMILKLDLQT